MKIRFLNKIGHPTNNTHMYLQENIMYYLVKKVKFLDAVASLALGHDCQTGEQQMRV